MKRIIIAALLLASSAALADWDNPGAVIAQANDETFVIATNFGNVIMKAQSYCFGIREGDKVLFERMPYGCAWNKFVVLRTGKTCSVWCE
jgi:hypothetical protein